MKILKRVLSVLAIILAVIFLIASIAGIAGAWIVHNRLSVMVNNVFDVTDRVLIASNTAINEVVSFEGELRSGINEIQTKVAGLGSNVAENPVLFQAIDDLLDGKISSGLQKLDQVTTQLYANLTQLQVALNALNSIAFFSPQGGLIDEVSTFLNDFLASAEQLNQDVQAFVDQINAAKEQAVDTIVQTVSQPLEQIDNRLAQSQERLTGLSNQLTQVQTDLDNTRQNLLRLLTIAAIVMTFVLLWFAFSQYAVIQLALQSYRAAGSPAVLPPAAPQAQRPDAVESQAAGPVEPVASGSDAPGLSVEEKNTQASPPEQQTLE
jgi:hypothetical protein